MKGSIQIPVRTTINVNLLTLFIGIGTKIRWCLNAALSTVTFELLKESLRRFVVVFDASLESLVGLITTTKLSTTGLLSDKIS